jgi:hypothetical protein
MNQKELINFIDQTYFERERVKGWDNLGENNTNSDNNLDKFTNENI